MVSYNPNITWNIIISNNWDWDWSLLSLNPSITVDDIISNSDYPWDWYQASDKFRNRADYVFENMHHNWCWSSVLYGNITWEIIDNYPELKLNTLGILRWILVRGYEERILELITSHGANDGWYFLSQNPHLTEEFVRSNYDKPWYWELVCKTVDIPIYDLVMLPDIDMTALSNHPKLTWELITTRDDWNWRILSRNTFGNIIDK